MRRRAGERCECCHLPRAGHDERSSIDHVIAIKHGGVDAATNLAFSCLRCNLTKGPNLGGIDAETAQTIQLFNPRQQAWPEHFQWNGPVLVGKTPEGRRDHRRAANERPRAQCSPAKHSFGKVDADRLKNRREFSTCRETYNPRRAAVHTTTFLSTAVAYAGS